MARERDLRSSSADGVDQDCVWHDLLSRAILGPDHPGLHSDRHEPTAIPSRDGGELALRYDLSRLSRI
jgi:hypothetical protein